MDDWVEPADAGDDDDGARPPTHLVAIYEGIEWAEAVAGLPLFDPFGEGV